MKITNYIPESFYQNIFKIDYERLWNEKKRVLLFDIDNTIGSYATPFPNKETVELFNSLKEKGFKIFLWSNSPLERVSLYGKQLNVPYLCKANKPFLGKVRKFIASNDIDLNKAIAIGDQLTTDVYMASKLNIPCVLVDPIDKESEYWYTKFNRKMINFFVVTRIKKIDIDLYNILRRING